MYFTNRGCANAVEELVDVTLERMMLRLEAQSPPPGVTALQFAYGFARNIALEHGRTVSRRVALPPDPDSAAWATPRGGASLHDGPHERAMDCLEHALGRLPSADREALLKYTVDARTGGAAASDKLRRRMSRLRKKVTLDFEECLESRQHDHEVNR
jgi:DNA-directed RNA polymerase specialized sigma24 family protein